VRIGAGLKGNGDYIRHNRFRSVAKIAGMKKSGHETQAGRQLTSQNRVERDEDFLHVSTSSHCSGSRKRFRDTNCAQLSRG